MIRQKYVRKSHARRAAIASLSVGVVEGRDFRIFKFQDGGFGYEELKSITGPDGHISTKGSVYFEHKTTR